MFSIIPFLNSDTRALSEYASHRISERGQLSLGDEERSRLQQATAFKHSLHGLVDVHASLFQLTGNGNVDWPSTLSLARRLAHDGVRSAIATLDDEPLDRLQSLGRQLNRLLDQHSVPLETIAASVLSFDEYLLDRAHEHRVNPRTSMTQYVLVRPPRHSRLPMVSVVNELVQMRLTPVFVAAESCEMFHEDEVRLRRVVDAGCLIHVNASAFSNSRVQLHRNCMRWIRKGMCHFVSSGDTASKLHTEQSIDERMPLRWPSMTMAYASVRSECGKRLADRLFRDNANSLVSGLSIGRDVTWQDRLCSVSGVATLATDLLPQPLPF